MLNILLTPMKAYKYKIYHNKRKNGKLNELINASCHIWNHVCKLNKRYYRLFGKGVSSTRMQSHIAKIRKNKSYWKQLNSQSVQEIVQRFYASMDRYFKKTQKRLPKSKPFRHFTSFLLKQSGYSINGNVLTINGIGEYRFSKSRDYGNIRNVRIKRNKFGEYFIIITSDKSVEDTTYGKSHNGAAVGCDFGLKTYLTLSDGVEIQSPLFYEQLFSRIRKAHKRLSTTKKGSSNRKRRRLELARLYDRLSNLRSDHHWKLAHQLCKEYGFISFETLNLAGMKKLFGKKVSDLSFGNFLTILKYVSDKYGTIIHNIDRWYPSSKTCYDCGYVNNELKLKDREWECVACGVTHERDLNASNNILRQGIVEYRSRCKTPLAGQSMLMVESNWL
jgi:putative transposase